MKNKKKKIISLVVTLIMLMSLIPAIPTQAASINIGDYLIMGKYYDEPILWRCVDIDENGPLMLSDKIISIKPFDAAGDNIANNSSHGRRDNNGYYRKLYGSNFWEDSNMRSWLNSTADSGNVDWLCGNPPIRYNVWNNDYANEKGFLSDDNFTQDEINAIKIASQKSILDGFEYTSTLHPNYHRYDYNIDSVLKNYDTAYSSIVTDKMFLLDIKQLYKVYENRNILGDNYYRGQLTQKVVDKSEYKDSYFIAGEYWHYWLRSPDADSYYGDNTRYVSTSGSVYSSNVTNGDKGVRPAFYLNISSIIFKSGNGSFNIPYMLNENTSIKYDVNIGDYVIMGSYYDEPILWRCVDIDDNGPLMLSDKIISIKPFDVGGDNTANKSSHGRGDENGYYRRLFGSNFWEDSNVRSWLNSTASPGNVIWLCGNPPTKDKVRYNAYSGEKGFLADGNFSKDERNAIKTVSQKSLLDAFEYSLTINRNYHRENNKISSVLENYDTAYSSEVIDKMFLLDVKQVNRVYENSPTLGDNYYIGRPTQKAIDNSEYKDASLSSDQNCRYWLRTPRADTYKSNSVRYVALHDYLSSINADYYNGWGIRPAFYLNLSSIIFKSGNGSISKPYADVETYPVKAYIKSLNYGDGVISVEPEVFNVYDDYTICLALYGDSNKLLALRMQENTVDSDIEPMIINKILDGYTEYELKLLLWDKELLPLVQVDLKEISK